MNEDIQLRCVFCGDITADWWYSDKINGVCRCRSCAAVGVSETLVEYQHHQGFKFNPVKNRNLFSDGSIVDLKQDDDEGRDVLHTIRFAPEGSLIEFSPSLPPRAMYRGKRGEVAGFSVRSRSRLNKKISMLQRENLPLFVTLTYHEDIPSDFEGYKYHLHHFFIALFRKYPRAGAIWKLEYQFRGYAHYHLFLWGVPLADRDFIASLWSGIAGGGSADHLKWHKGELGNGNEHCVQSVRSWHGVKSYASKYFAKLDDDKTRGGRVWGVRGKGVPMSFISTYRVNLDVALEFRQAIIEARQYEFTRLGFWCTDYSPDWMIFLDNLITADEVLRRVPDDPPDWDFGEGLLFEHVFGHVVEVFQYV